MDTSARLITARLGATQLHASVHHVACELTRRAVAAEAAGERVSVDLEGFVSGHGAPVGACCAGKVQPSNLPRVAPPPAGPLTFEDAAPRPARRRARR